MKQSLIVAVLITAILVAIYLFVNKTSRTQMPQMTQKSQSQENLKDAPAVSIYTANLEVPWAIVFLPDRNMLVTERPGRVKTIDSNGKVLESINITVHAVGEGGLHGITLDPDFSSNKYIYLYHTFSGEGNNTLNRVVRYKFENEKLSEEKIIVDRIPGASNHDGGRIKFGPDKFLYITTGDAQEPSLAQNRDSLAGKILRVTRDGNPAPGNPFDSAQGEPFGTRIYSYGHRNPQGIAWDDRNRLWETEHGSSATDEINLIEPGKNYGWPQVRGDEKRAGIQLPTLQSGSDTWAPAGAAFYNGSIFFGGLKGQALYEYKIGEQKLVEHLKNKYGRIRDVVLGPDEMLYITTSNRDGRGSPANDDDKILRINPAKL